jgi:membrane protease YdiL (CAAX protease family)
MACVCASETTRQAPLSGGAFHTKVPEHTAPGMAYTVSVNPIVPSEIEHMNDDQGTAPPQAPLQPTSGGQYPQPPQYPAQPDGQQPYGQPPQQPYQQGGPAYGYGYPPPPPPPPSMPDLYGTAGPQPAPARMDRTDRLVLAIGSLGFLLAMVAFALIGELGRFLTVGIQVAPLALLAVLAYAGVKNEGMAVLAYVGLALVAMAVLLNSFISALAPVLDMSSALNDTNPADGPPNLLKPGAGSVVLWATVLLLIAVTVSALMLWRPVRVAMARIIPIDPDNFVHKIALSILTLLLLTSFVPIIALGGKPPILEIINSGGLDVLGEEPVSEFDLVGQFIWTIPAVVFAAGWPIVRTLRAALVRLGMVRPTSLQVAGAILGAVVLAFGMTFAVEPAIFALWEALGWTPTDVSAFSELLGGVTNPVGAILIGVTAGIGEEMAFRGLLQPRIGLIFANLLFTSVHAFQYGFDALLSVFIVGTILGIVRARTNTSTAAILHGVYNFTLVMMSVLNIVGQ